MHFLANNFESFGLDIGDRSLKMAFVRKKSDHIALLSYGTMAVAADILDKGEIKNRKELSNLIQKLLFKLTGKKNPTPYVNACLPEPKSFLKLITIKPCAGNGKKTKKEEINEALQLELPNHIPIKTEDLALDWQVISEDGESMHILVGAAPKQIAEDYTNLLLEAGLKPMSLQIEAEAILRSLLPINDIPQAPLAIIDLGASRSGFICFDKQTIQFTVSLPIAGETMTELVGSSLKLNTQEAERAKKICGLDENRCEGAIANVLKPVVVELANAIKKNIAFYVEHFSNASPINNIILCGGSSNLKNLKAFLGEQLPQCDIHWGNPLVNIGQKIKNKRQTDKTKLALDFLNPAFKLLPSKDSLALPREEESSFATAIGLGLSNIKE